MARYHAIEGELSVHYYDYFEFWIQNISLFAVLLLLQYCYLWMLFELFFKYMKKLIPKTVGVSVTSSWTMSSPCPSTSAWYFSHTMIMIIGCRISPQMFQVSHRICSVQNDKDKDLYLLHFLHYEGELWASKQNKKMKWNIWLQR